MYVLVVMGVMFYQIEGTSYDKLKNCFYRIKDRVFIIIFCYLVSNRLTQMAAQLIQIPMSGKKNAMTLLNIQ